MKTKRHIIILPILMSMLFVGCSKPTIEDFAQEILIAIHAGNTERILSDFDVEMLKQKIPSLENIPVPEQNRFNEIVTSQLKAKLDGAIESGKVELVCITEANDNIFLITCRIGDEGDLNYSVFYVFKTSAGDFRIYDYHNVWSGQRMSESMDLFLQRKLENMEEFNNNLMLYGLAQQKIANLEYAAAMEVLNEVSMPYAQDINFVLLQVQAASYLDNDSLLESQFQHLIKLAPNQKSKLLYETTLASHKGDMMEFEKKLAAIEELFVDAKN